MHFFKEKLRQHSALHCITVHYRLTQQTDHFALPAILGAASQPYKRQAGCKICIYAAGAALGGEETVYPRKNKYYILFMSLLSSSSPQVLNVVMHRKIKIST